MQWGIYETNDKFYSLYQCIDNSRNLEPPLSKESDLSVLVSVSIKNRYHFVSPSQVPTTESAMVRSTVSQEWSNILPTVHRLFVMMWQCWNLRGQRVWEGESVLSVCPHMDHECLLQQLVTSQVRWNLSFESNPWEISKDGWHTHTHARTHVRTHTHTRAHARTHAHTHTHTHTHEWVQA